MKKWLILFVNLSLMYLSAKSQIFYEDNMVNISGYLSDSSLFIQIVNVSDSVLIFNGKNINFAKARENIWTADLSLLTSSISILQPSYGHFMSFKRLLPQEKYTAVAYDFYFPEKPDSFKLFIQIDYMIIPSQFIITDNVLYEQFVELVKDKKLKVHSYKGKLGINRSESNNYCKSFLQSK